MSTTIWKFPIDAGCNSIQAPRGAKLLTVQMQHGSPTVWAEVDPTAPIEPVLIEVFGTGHVIEEGERTYVGTFQMQGGALVFHLYQRHH